MSTGLLCCHRKYTVVCKAMEPGSVWIGIYTVEKYTDWLKDYFKFHENIVPFSLIAIGHPDEKKPKSARYDKKKV